MQLFILVLQPQSKMKICNFFAFWGFLGLFFLVVFFFSVLGFFVLLFCLVVLGFFMVFF